MGAKKRGTLFVNGADSPTTRLTVGIPMTGQIRSEWMLARYGQVTPCNWSQSDINVWMDTVVPLRFSVADARNLIVNHAVKGGFEWLIFIDHDVVLPTNTLVKMNDYMLSGKYPIVNGLYFTRAMPSSPLMYRGVGTSYYTKWKMGDKVWVDGCGLGCTLINVKILKIASEMAELYSVRGNTIPRVFRTPAFQVVDEVTGEVSGLKGTEDLDFYDNIKANEIYAKAGWKKIQNKKHSLLLDTSIFCRHIDPAGLQYPAAGEEKRFLPKGKRK